MPRLLADSLRRRFRFHAWASGALADALLEASCTPGGQPLPEALDRARGVLAHTLVADRVWLMRLRGERTDALALWPTLDARGLRLLAQRNADAYEDLLEPLADDDLARVAAYRALDGTRHRSAVHDVLEHVLLHGAHHRGQAAAALRAAGVAPPRLDYIAWVRARDAPPDDLTG
ncbi:MAG: DinB family protein [Rubricoccaceae bacterium]